MPNALLLLLLAAAAPATGPAASTPWLERAQREIAASPVETPADLNLAQPQESAICLYRLAPTDERRRLAIGLIDRAVKAEIDRKRSDEQMRAAYIAGALCHARVDDPAAARTMLAAADRPTGAPPTTEPLAWLMDGFVNGFRAETCLRIGDEAGFERAKLTPIAWGFVESNLRADGLDAEADHVRAWANTHAEAAATGPVDPLESPGSRLLEQVRHKVAAGDLRGAFKAARDLEAWIKSPAGRASSTLYFAFEAYEKVARGCLDSDDLNGFHAARDSLAALLREFPSRPSSIHAMFDLCIRAKDAAGFATLASLSKSEWHNKELYAIDEILARIHDLAQFAAQYAAIGDQNNYKAEIGTAEQLLAGLKIDSKSDPSIVTNRVSAFLWIAAAHARAGDTKAVARDVKASRAAGTLDADGWDDAWWNVVYGYADAGRFSEALAAAGEARTDTHKFLSQYIAHRQAQAGKFDDCWQTLRPLPTPTRLKGEYDLIVREVQAGRLSGLAARIDAMPTTNECALSDLAVGATLIGNPYPGNLRAFLQKD